jgi:hypothetical protein
MSDVRGESVNALDQICVNSESGSIEIDETDLQPEKHFEQRM